MICNGLDQSTLTSNMAILLNLIFKVPINLSIYIYIYLTDQTIFDQRDQHGSRRYCSTDFFPLVLSQLE